MKTNKEIKIEFNYDRKMMVLISCGIVINIILGYWLGYITSIILIFMMILPLSLFKFYRYILLTDNECVFKPWIGKEKRVLTKQIRAIHHQKGDTSILTFETHSMDKGIVNLFISPQGYAIKKTNTTDSFNSEQNEATLIQELEKFAEQYNIPFQTINQKTMSDTEVGQSLRFIVYPALILFIGMLYFDMTVIEGVHFNTMNFLMPSVVIVLFTCIFCYLFLKLRKDKNVLLNALIFGGALGLLLSSVAKSYIHWYDENNVNEIVQYYPMKLDDYDSHKDEQRWLIESKEAEVLIGEDRLILFGMKGDRIMNNKLVEEKTYSIPVAVGIFNDVFIPKDGFMNAKEVEE